MLLFTMKIKKKFVLYRGVIKFAVIQYASYWYLVVLWETLTRFTFLSLICWEISDTEYRNIDHFSNLY